MKIQAKLNPQTNFPFAMEIHDSCLSPNSKKALNWVKTDKSSSQSLYIHTLSHSYGLLGHYYLIKVEAIVLIVEKEVK